jgi:DNA ligase-1
MLAKPTRGIGDILNRFDGKHLTCEYKYDGLRGQVHYNEGKIEIFSRNLENLTAAYVDIIHEINKNIEAIKLAELKSFILDC